MIIEQNGVRVGLEIDGNNLKFQVLDQAEETTKLLRSLGSVTDEVTGFSMRTNKFPSFNHQENRFYLRGTVAEKNAKEVVAKFDNPARAREAVTAIGVLLSKIRPPNGVATTPGSTAACRLALIPRDMAIALRLTDCKNWPAENKWTPAHSMQIGNPHFDEHLAQIVDVLNKAHGAEIVMDRLHEQVAANVHLEKVEREGASWAVAAVKRLLAEGHARGLSAETSLWRIFSGLRAPDVVDSQIRALRAAGVDYDSDRPNVNNDEGDDDINEDDNDER